MSVSIDKAVVSRLFISGRKFEILVDPYKALDLKKGIKINMDEILAYPAIYRDVRSTECVPENELQKFFGTTDIFKVAERIIKEGELQLTTEQRRKMVEQKKNQIANIIAKRGINPQTNTPHPPQRILNAIEKVGVSIDPFIDAELQVDKVLKEIKSLLPIKFQKITLNFKIPPQYSTKVFSMIKRSTEIKSEKWLNDGSLELTVEILAGVQDEIFQKISSLTHGNFESKIMKREDV
ncbi:MAG: ribosome assembly factor SBDS [Candidatus Aenigmatarchaeota archaeon]